MKRIAIAASVAVLVFGVAILAKTQTASVEQELMKLENAWNDATVKHDWAFFDQILADDFIGTDFNGNVGTKPEFLESLKSVESVITSSITDDMKVRIYGDVAVVTGRTTTVNEQYKGKLGGSPFAGFRRRLTWV